MVEKNNFFSLILFHSVQLKFEFRFRFNSGVRRSNGIRSTDGPDWKKKKKYAYVREMNDSTLGGAQGHHHSTGGWTGGPPTAVPKWGGCTAALVGYCWGTQKPPLQASKVV